MKESYYVTWVQWGWVVGVAFGLTVAAFVGLALLERRDRQVPDENEDENE